MSKRCEIQLNFTGDGLENYYDRKKKIINWWKYAPHPPQSYRGLIVYDDRMVVESFWVVHKIPQFASARCYKWLKNLAKTRRKHFNKMHKSDCNVENMSIQVLEKKKSHHTNFFKWKIELNVRTNNKKLSSIWTE